MENLTIGHTNRTLSLRAKREAKLVAQKRIKSLLALFSVLLIAIIVSMYVYINKQDFVIESQQEKVSNLYSEIVSAKKENQLFAAKISVVEQKLEESVKIIDGLQSTIIAQNKTISELDANIESLKSDNKALAKDNKALLKEVDELTDKINLYEKYKYAVYDKAGKRTDLTYDQLKTGEELMKEKGYDPDLLFGMLMVESSGNEKAANRTSTARGYAQFLKGTGKYVYEDLCKIGNNYNHNSHAMNGDVAIVMMASYLDHLYKLYNGNIIKVIQHYSGRSLSSTYSYMNRINSYIKTVNKDVYKMSVSIK